eukprot:scaffold25027_cov72-Phaeocystis_antarctica.AAC.1
MIALHPWSLLVFAWPPLCLITSSAPANSFARKKRTVVALLLHTDLVLCITTTSQSLRLDASSVLARFRMWLSPTRQSGRRSVGALKDRVSTRGAMAGSVQRREERARLPIVRVVIPRPQAALTARACVAGLGACGPEGLVVNQDCLRLVMTVALLLKAQLALPPRVESHKEGVQRVRSRRARAEWRDPLRTCSRRTLEYHCLRVRPTDSQQHDSLGGIAVLGYELSARVHRRQRLHRLTTGVVLQGSGCAAAGCAAAGCAAAGCATAGPHVPASPLEGAASGMVLGGTIHIGVTVSAEV